MQKGRPLDGEDPDSRASRFKGHVSSSLTLNAINELHDGFREPVFDSS